MAGDSDSSEERTEEATPRRREEARKKGQVARSKDLTTAVALVAGAVSLIIFGPSIFRTFHEIALQNFQLSREVVFNQDAMSLHLSDAVLKGMLSILGPLVVMMVATLAGSVMMGGMLFSAESLMPKFERMDPLKGIKKMFSVRSLIELVKAILKFLLVAVCCYFILRGKRDEIMAMANEPVMEAIPHVMSLVGWSVVWMSASLILVAAVDAPAQWFTFMREMRMTKQEVKDEYKDTEGKPEVKGRIRQLQRQMAEARMMVKVPEADVIITNPTHYAVALKYDPANDNAPILLAKGIDHMAMRIREVARENQVVQVEAPPLARAIYYSTDLDREIPSGLYMAVAQVLTWIHRLRRYQNGAGRHPGKLPDVPIPDDLRRDP